MTDITYIRVVGGLWLYLCVVVDLYSGLVAGWSMSRCQNRQLVLQTVLMAPWQRGSRLPVILHSDRGCQFTSDEYQRFLKGHNLTCSIKWVEKIVDASPSTALRTGWTDNVVDLRQKRGKLTSVCAGVE